MLNSEYIKKNAAKEYLNHKLNKRKIQNEVEDQEEDEKRSRLKRTRRRLTLIDSGQKRVKQKKMIMITPVVRQMMTIVQEKVIVVFA